MSYLNIHYFMVFMLRRNDIDNSLGADSRHPVMRGSLEGPDILDRCVSQRVQALNAKGLKSQIPAPGLNGFWNYRGTRDLKYWICGPSNIGSLDPLEFM